MATNTGTLVAASIRPADSNDPIASAFSNEIKGGHHVYATLVERNAIITARRDWGMLVTVYNDPVFTNNVTYQLKYLQVDNDITNNSNWVPYATSTVSGSGGEWVSSVFSITGTPPATASNGDRYLISTVASGVWVGNENKIAEWNITNNTWDYTIPTTSMSVISDNYSNSIFRYIGTYPTGTWSNTKLSTIRYASLTGNGVSYSVTDIQSYTYSNEYITICQFNTDGSGGTTSININNLGYKLIKKDVYGTLENLDINDISTGILYQLIYDGTQFQILNPSAGGTRLQIKNIINNETITVPVNYQYLVYGDLILQGTSSLINYGSVVTINGDLVIGTSSSFLNFGTYDSPSLLQKLKYAATQSYNANQTYSISHNLNSGDIIYMFRDSTGTAIVSGITVNITDENTILVNASSTQSNIRLTIMA